MWRRSSWRRRRRSSSAGRAALSAVAQPVVELQPPSAEVLRPSREWRRPRTHAGPPVCGQITRRSALGAASADAVMATSLTYSRRCARYESHGPGGRHRRVRRSLEGRDSRDVGRSRPVRRGESSTGRWPPGRTVRPLPRSGTRAWAAARRLAGPGADGPRDLTPGLEPGARAGQVRDNPARRPGDPDGQLDQALSVGDIKPLLGRSPRGGLYPSCATHDG
jgi:hypothetical protein